MNKRTVINPKKVSVAVVMMINSTPEVGGELSDLFNTVTSLEIDTRISADPILFTEERQTPAWNFAIENGLLIKSQDSFSEILAKYDYIVFSAAGNRYDRKSSSPWWKQGVDNLKRPFAVKICGDDHVRLFPYREVFFNHPNCTAILPITPGMKEFSAPESKKPVFLFHPWNYAELHKSELPHQSGKKRALLVTTSMLAKRKRMTELILCASKLSSVVEIEVHGVSFAWSELGNMRKAAHGGWKYCGKFTPAQLPNILSPAMFHYNGCCPILNRTFAPDWVTDDMAILVELENGTIVFPSRSKSLSAVLEESKKKYRKMNSKFIDALRKHCPLTQVTRVTKHILENVHS